MATSVGTKVLILGHSFVRRLANDLRRECVDRAVVTFNASWLDVRTWRTDCSEVARLRSPSGGNISLTFQFWRSVLMI